ncbi:MAG: hypothetical protein D6776_09035 [Planctomycetota bacterium]|nr:MAG: hypothetical protein D6776_09035 [Planctomycetota bacterium]
MSDWERLRRLPLRIESWDCVLLRSRVSSGFERLSTMIILRGGGQEGRGEDVTYAAEDHEALATQRPALGLAGAWSLQDFSTHLADCDLYPQPPVRDEQRPYRRWAFESAALDLALRQAQRSLPEVLERTPAPLHFVVSLRLGDPPSFEPLRRRLERYPDLTFKLDPTSAWTDELIARVAATGAVRILDFKGHYRGTPVDQPADPDLYARVIEAFPDAWLEDPALTPETRAVLAGHWDRVTWDAPIHGVADLEALEHTPRCINIKPSRFGSLSSLLETYAWCEARGVRCYGGGQFELDVGRGQSQLLAALYHPDAPNDLAPVGYNRPEPAPGLPSSPLPPPRLAAGFRWPET